MSRPQPKPSAVPASLEIVTLGDSLAYGAGDEVDGGIANRVKAELRARGVATVRTTNLGMNGAQTSDVIDRLKQERIRNALKDADAIVLSVGANDLFRTPNAQQQVLKNPVGVAKRILDRLQTIVKELHTINPTARILLLGGYNPVPDHQWAPMIDQYLTMWDASVAARFENDPLVSIVTMSDIVTARRLSRYDHFHPGAEAYQEASKRIATMLL